MAAIKVLLWILAITATALLVSTVVLAVLLNQDSDDRREYRALCYPNVIAHRGASGYVPEHTLGAYALAIEMGSDYVEPDLVMTSDGHLIARHDNELGLSTDVSEHPEFANRYKTQTVDSFQLTGWFSEDFTLAEIKTLRSIERIPATRPGNARMDKAFDVPTFQEIIDLVKSMETRERRRIGIYPEIKHATHFQQLGLPMEQALVDVFHRNGYTSVDEPVYIQSFEVNNLRELKNMTDLKLLQLYSVASFPPYDQFILGTNVTFGSMATATGLLEVAMYAHAVGPDKSYIIPRTAANNLGIATTFVADAHAAGLQVHPYTFRAENVYLPVEFRSDDTSASAIGNLQGELEAFMNAGVDGWFVDQPDVAVRLSNC